MDEVSVEIEWLAEEKVDRGGIVAFGLVLAAASGRSVRVLPGARVGRGGFSAGPGAKVVSAKKGTMVEVDGVPRAAAEEELTSDQTLRAYRILPSLNSAATEAKPDPAPALRTERALLVTRIAEIDRQLAAAAEVLPADLLAVADDATPSRYIF